MNNHDNTPGTKLLVSMRIRKMVDVDADLIEDVAADLDEIIRQNIAVDVWTLGRLVADYLMSSDYVDEVFAEDAELIRLVREHREKKRWAG